MHRICGIEMIAYSSAWTLAVLYSMYNFHKSTDGYIKYFENDLAEGWKWVGRRIDTSDYEWNVLSPILLEWFRHVVPFISLSILLKRKTPNFVALTSIILSFYWLYNLLGLPLTLFIYIQPMMFSAISRISSMFFVWMACLSFSLGLHSEMLREVKLLIFGEDSQHREYFFAALLAWTQARSVSYLIDTQELPNVNKSVKNFFYYCFYFPVLPSGPLLLYRDFDASLRKIERKQQICCIGLLEHFLKLTRYLLWWGFYQFALHFFYHTALQYHPGLVRQLDMWSTGGLGYSLCQFFMLKYVILYGVPSSLANLDEIEAPPAPKCISRIHLYSQMWRDFDRGLYNFMLNYIYIPFKGPSEEISRKLFASALCFGFVCIWHGAFPAVIIWCVLNYAGICLESLGKHLSTLEPIATWKAQWTPVNWIRFQALAASPLLLMSALSNFCFFTDATVGSIFARKVLEGGLQQFLFILAIMYCCCHVSIALRQRDPLFLHHKNVYSIKEN